MKPIHIFRAGKHRPANGGALEFSESDLQASAEAYDPALHEAPITVGHPKDNKPAFGWVQALNYSDGNLHADPHQVNEDFAEMVNGGRFKHRSASFYKPDAPSNPAPGVYYLRHVAFLGAEPPAVKGLEPYHFSEDEEGVVEFADPQVTASIVARMFRSMRDAWIDKFGRDDADKVLPEFFVEDLEAEARTNTDSEADPAFSETPSNTPKSEGDMTPEQLKAKQDELDKRDRELKEREQQIDTERANFAEQAAQARRDEDVRFVERLVSENKILPAQKEQAAALLGALDHEEATVQFAEGENKIAPRDALKRFLEDQPERIDFKEKSGSDKGGDTPDTMSPREIAEKAIKFQEEQANEGRTVTIGQATAHVMEQLDAAA